MGSFSPSSPPAKKDLPSLLSSALPFLNNDLSSISPLLPSLLSTLRSVGAGQCWHKHGTFLAHLTDVFKILHLWSSPLPVSLCGLFHSAYSNSYVNLAIFDPNTSRDRLHSLLGPAAERLVHLFCVVNRQTLIHDSLLFRYTDEELRHNLKTTPSPVVPANGITVKHIRTGEDVVLSRRVVAAFLLMTMADFSDQLFGFQDELFENVNGRLDFKGNSPATALWPGDGKPGLWLNSVSRMGAIYNLILREEELYIKENGSSDDRDEDLELVLPPVFDYCTKVLDVEEQRVSRDLYWEAVTGKVGLERAEELLLESIKKNGYVGEPCIVLAQVYLGMGKYEEAEREAEKGVRLLLEWGSGWDKRVSWEGWVSWGRVLLMKAREKDWPETSWGILNLGLVK